MAEFIKNLQDLKSIIAENKIYRFKIKVIAGSKVNSIEFYEDFIKIKISQRAVEGKANKAIIEYLSDILKIPKTKIEILSGKTASIKTIQISI